MSVPTRREQVFVSSTYLDLVAERQEVIQTLLEADCFPAGMELFPASDDDRWTLIRREIDDSDYYIVIVGGRYGSIDPGSGLSYTEMEFDYAVETGKPVMGFLHGSPGAIAVEKSDLDADPRRQLEAFREKVSERIVRFWSSPQELGGQVAKSLIKIRRSHPAEGWVRARTAATPEMIDELRSLQLRVRELEAELRERASASDSASLASGDDMFAIRTRLRYWTRKAVDEGRTTYRNSSTQHDVAVSVSWNQVVAAVGPSLMVEATTQVVEEQIRQLALDEYPEVPSDYGKMDSFVVFDESVDDVLVQLRGLGLIEESTRRHPPSDTNHYWTLTPAGEGLVIKLRAAVADSANELADGPPSPKQSATSKRRRASKKSVAKKVASTKKAAGKRAAKKSTA